MADVVNESLSYTEANIIFGVIIVVLFVFAVVSLVVACHIMCSYDH